MDPADIWLSADEAWFTPPDADGHYQDPLTAWSDGDGGILRDGRASKRFSPQSTQVVKLLRHLYVDLQSAWVAGWRWETQAPAVANHRFFPPQHWVDEYISIPFVASMKGAGPKVGLSSPDTKSLIEGKFGDSVLKDPRGMGVRANVAVAQAAEEEQEEDNEAVD